MTEKQYTQAELDAAVSAERERCAQTCELTGGRLIKGAKMIKDFPEQRVKAYVGATKVIAEKIRKGDAI
jgi:hypothetical protein